MSHPHHQAMPPATIVIGSSRAGRLSAQLAGLRPTAPRPARRDPLVDLCPGARRLVPALVSPASPGPFSFGPLLQRVRRPPPIGGVARWLPSPRARRAPPPPLAPTARPPTSPAHPAAE